MDSYSPKYRNDRFWLLESQTSELVFGGSRLTHNHHWLKWWQVAIKSIRMQEKDREAMLNPVSYARSGDFSRNIGWLFEGILRWKLLLRCKSWKNWMAIRTSFACPDPSSICVGDLKSCEELGSTPNPGFKSWVIVRCVHTQRFDNARIEFGILTSVNRQQGLPENLLGATHLTCCVDISCLPYRLINPVRDASDPMIFDSSTRNHWLRFSNHTMILYDYCTLCWPPFYVWPGCVWVVSCPPRIDQPNQHHSEPTNQVSNHGLS